MDEGEVDTDAVLLIAARQGDAAALAELKARHTPVARRLAVELRPPRGLGRRDRHGRVHPADQPFRPWGRGEGELPGLPLRQGPPRRRDVGRTPAQRARPAGPHRPDHRRARRGTTRQRPRVHQPVVRRAVGASPGGVWHATVEGAGPAELGKRLHLSTDSAAAATYRAREELRSGYLRARAATPHRSPRCSPHAERLDAFVRRSLKHRDRIETAAHLEVCADCREIVDELSDVSVLLLRATVPLLLGFSLLTGLPPVEAPPFRAIRAQRRGPHRPHGPGLRLGVPAQRADRRRRHAAADVARRHRVRHLVTQRLD